ncbi:MULTISPECIES: SCO family protein [Streptomyces]|uniref:SCO family protein n=1 Tax=Streptomyces xinghaiensis TaxID=1038928 RepID=A0A3R7H883_9ACTN|nr:MULTISPECIES: SCO family protein [Streptomyces]PQM23177.1 SCO family protein [Streptomyces xinghaiensis]RKM91542.1 SCO family protein [Streptomyces xinghaiensis]RNC74821.1 SCO family protein [Streptomyces xinghaiensis]
MRTTHRPARKRGARRTPLWRGSVLAVTAALALSACGGDGDGSAGTAAEVSAEPSKAATVLDNPFDKPDLVLTDTSGQEYDLVEETKGHPTLLYFGYTHCPDVCPLTMSNIAVASKALSEDQRKDLRVVFVTSDPERDTPQRLGAWLRGQDPDFIGLTGDFDAIQAGARSVGIGIAPPTEDENGDIVSTHGAQVLAFSPEDDKAHVLYGEDTTVDDYTADLPKLLEGETP